MKTEEEVYFKHHMKKQILDEKKHAAAEKAETEKYLELKKQYVCYIRIYFQSIKKSLEIIVCIFLNIVVIK